MALTSRNNNNNKLMVLTQSIHPLTLVITHFYNHRLNQASVLVPCIHLCRLSNALEINQANFLIQLALQLSSLNSLDRILGWHPRSTLFKLLDLSTWYFLHLNRKRNLYSNSSTQNGQFMSACSDSPLQYLCLCVKISLTPNRNRSRASLNLSNSNAWPIAFWTKIRFEGSVYFVVIGSPQRGCPVLSEHIN